MANTVAKQARGQPTKLELALWRLPDTARDALARHMPPLSATDGSPAWAGLPDDVQLYAQGREALSHLSADVSTMMLRLRQLADAAGKAAAAIQADVRTGPRPAKLGEAIQDLGRIWFELTGKPPRLGSSAYSEDNRGPFGNFVRAVVLLLWPGAGSMGGYVRDVCRSYRGHSAQ
jgi:hypothetical protein